MRGTIWKNRQPIHGDESSVEATSDLPGLVVAPSEIQTHHGHLQERGIIDEVIEVFHHR